MYIYIHINSNELNQKIELKVGFALGYIPVWDDVKIHQTLGGMCFLSGVYHIMPINGIFKKYHRSLLWLKPHDPTKTRILDMFRG
jgi:hypothetical protein